MYTKCTMWNEVRCIKSFVQIWGSPLQAIFLAFQVSQHRGNGQKSMLRSVMNSLECQKKIRLRRANRGRKSRGRSFLKSYASCVRCPVNQDLDCVRPNSSRGAYEYALHRRPKLKNTDANLKKMLHYTSAVILLI